MIERFPTHQIVQRWLWSAGVLAAQLMSQPAQAQRILGLGDDAITIPRGTLRVGVTADHTLQSVRWHDGRLETLGAPFSGAALGPLQLSILGPLQQLVRDLGVPDFAASLGAPTLEMRQRLFVTPLSLEYGVTNSAVVEARDEQHGIFAATLRLTLPPLGIVILRAPI